uniref:Uncharacterized protein n=1 Tax=Rhizophora mucronata TaxID=61149 RepID=A0A2P2QBF7_RHIMU
MATQQILLECMCTLPMLKERDKYHPCNFPISLPKSTYKSSMTDSVLIM